MIKGIILDFNRTVYDPEKDKLTDGVLELLDNLKKSDIPLCLLSKKTREDRRDQITDLGLDEYFIDIQVIEGNKTEMNFHQCLDKMHLNPHEVLVVGDRIKSEIVLGNKLGMKTIWYKSGKFANELPDKKIEEPNHTVSKLSEIRIYL